MNFCDKNTCAKNTHRTGTKRKTCTGTESWKVNPWAYFAHGPIHIGNGVLVHPLCKEKLFFLFLFYFYFAISNSIGLRFDSNFRGNFMEHVRHEKKKFPQ